jgi:hypothetical protein
MYIETIQPFYPLSVARDAAQASQTLAKGILGGFLIPFPIAKMA